jgi:hypothetical protein
MSQEIINHLSELARLTNNMKYYIDIADILSQSPYIGDKDKAIEIYSSFMGSGKLCRTVINDKYVQEKIATRLNKKTLDFTLLPNSLTVIIPTLWKANPNYFKWNLDILQEDCRIKEIIIHDNNPNDRFSFDWSRYKKVRFVDDENRYVNKAWEYCVKQAQTEYYILLNDDCLVDHYILTSTSTILKKDEDVGLVVCDTVDVSINEFANLNNNYSAVYTNHIERCNNFWYAAGRVNEWYDIPEGLIIFFGDDWLRKKTLDNGKRVVQIISGKVSHALSQTVNALDVYKTGVLEKENEIFKKAIEVNQ